MNLLSRPLLTRGWRWTAFLSSSWDNDIRIPEVVPSSSSSSSKRSRKRRRWRKSGNQKAQDEAAAEAEAATEAEALPVMSSSYYITFVIVAAVVSFFFYFGCLCLAGGFFSLISSFIYPLLPLGIGGFCRHWRSCLFFSCLWLKAADALFCWVRWDLSSLWLTHFFMWCIEGSTTS